MNFLKFHPVKLLFLFSVSGFPKQLDPVPLILTPYIESRQIEKARRLSYVQDLKPWVPSYSGLITVDKKCNANLWFWFFPSKRNPSWDPVTVWLNGGPGLSSAFGLFLENGPYIISSNGELKLRKYTWTAYSSVLYVDNPVGTGFSFADMKKDCYRKNQTDVANNFITFLDQFFIMFPEYQNNSLYLFGESYSGKYVTSIAYFMLRNGSKHKLEGLGIGNGIIDPRNQEMYANNLFNLGLIDEYEMNEILKKERLIRNLIDGKRFKEAFKVREDILRTHKTSTGYNHWLNYLESGWGKLFQVDFETLMNSNDMRVALHVGNITRNKDLNDVVANEFMQSVRKWFEYVAERRRTLLYFGQMDLIVSSAGGANFIRRMNWSGRKQFNMSPRKFWKVRGKLAGYIKSEGRLTEVMVRNAGHSVPADQPLWAFTLYNNFIFNKF
ncbi:hypothetical protein RUM43_005155 [Polyplax serrata]|uniref:Carboxypeptidase n=1 Tax=Polyplax serrata TaxID=468196 RepID=A0AAN8XN34_POLSC